MVLFFFCLAGLVLAAVLLGVHLTGLVALNPALRAMEERVYVPMKRAVDVTAPRLAKPLMLSSLAATAGTLVTAAATGAVPVVAASATALAALFLTLLAILRGDLPINRAMASWSSEDLPANWREVRVRWERFFMLRVVTNTIALLASAVAVLVSAMALR